MFNPASLEALKHMTPEDMRRAGEMMSKLPPEQLKQMAAMSGMSGVDPRMMSQAASAMSQMSPETLNAMKSNLPAMSGQMPQQPAPPKSAPTVPSKLEPIVQMKNKGNEYFGKGQLLDAIEQYESAIKALEGQGLGQDVVNLEVTCRTNLATVEAKRQNWSSVITQCKQVLTFDPSSYKACFRYGQALMETGQVQKAEEMLEKARGLNPGDQAVEGMLAELRARKVDAPQAEPASKEEAKTESPKTEEVQPAPEEAKREEAKEEPKVETQLKNHQKNRGIKIEDVIDPPPARKTAVTQPPKEAPAQPQVPLPTPAVPMPMSGGRIDPSMMAQQREALKNMDDSQLSSMLDTMKHMDPATIAAMSKQFGMDVTPEQIQMMTQHLTPEMMRLSAGAAGQMPRVGSEEGKQEGAGAAAMPQMNSAFLQESLNNPAMAQMLSGLIGKQFGRSEDEAALVIGCLRRLVNIFVAISKVYNIFFAGRRKYVTGAALVALVSYYYS
jgi:tetratricopeptide (TPR) repeat protein